MSPQDILDALQKISECFEETGRIFDELGEKAEALRSAGQPIPVRPTLP